MPEIGRMKMLVQWNLTKKMKGIRKCDVLVISIGKSGRTWLRVMINKYISLAYDVPFNLDDLSSQNDSIPSILYTHEMSRHYGATLRERILGKYIVPDKIMSGKKVILMYRDPRDVIVSLYFHSLKRGRKKNKGLILMDMVSGKRNRMLRVVSVLNGWRKRLEGHPDCLWISYEDLMKDTITEFMSVLKHLDLNIIDRNIAEKAVDFAKFDNMKKMETQDQFKTNILRPGDPSDPDSYKVRKGEVGGYVNYFSEEEQLYLNSAMEDLDPFFGYKTTPD
jgi:hypothetical protein